MTFVDGGPFRDMEYIHECGGVFLSHAARIVQVGVGVYRAVCCDDCTWASPDVDYDEACELLHFHITSTGWFN